MCAFIWRSDTIDGKSHQIPTTTLDPPSSTTNLQTDNTNQLDNAIENLDRIKEGFIKSLKDIKIAGRGIPLFLKERIDPNSIKIEKTNVEGVYEVILPKGNEQGAIEGKVHINQEGKLVNEAGESGKETTLTLQLPGIVSLLYTPYFGESGGITELTKDGKMTPGQAQEIIGFIKGANLQGGKNPLVLSQNDKGLSVKKA